MKKKMILFAIFFISSTYAMNDEDYQNIEAVLRRGPLGLMNYDDNELVDFDNEISNSDVSYENIQQYNNEDSLSELSESPFDFEQYFNGSKVDCQEFQNEQRDGELLRYLYERVNTLSERYSATKPTKTYTGKKSYVCEHEGCNESFEQRSALKTHQKVHQKAPIKRKQYVCEYEGCGKAFAQKRSLTVHNRTHTGEKPYVCEYEGCGKAFAQKHHLTDHNRTHTGEEYICEYDGCGKTFAKKFNLNVHRRIHTGERPYICEYEGCDKACSDKSSLAKHARIHTGEKPHVCKYESCGKAFAQKSDLAKHARTHTGERPYACKYEGCGKAFGQKFTLDNHYKTHKKLN